MNIKMKAKLTSLISSGSLLLAPVSFYKLEDGKVLDNNNKYELNSRYNEYDYMIEILTNKNVEDSTVSLLLDKNLNYTIIDNR